MPLAGIANDVIKKAGRSFSETTYVPHPKKSGCGSIVGKVMRELEEKRREEEMRQADAQAMDWRQCRHMVNVGSRMTCKRFFSMCSMDKCNPKYFERKQEAGQQQP